MRAWLVWVAHSCNPNEQTKPGEEGGWGVKKEQPALLPSTVRVLSLLQIYRFNKKGPRQVNPTKSGTAVLGNGGTPE